MIILGSTGSIGTQALQIAKAENLPIEVLCGGDNIDLLNRQIAEFHPKIVVIKNSKKKHLVCGDSKILCGELGIIEAINLSQSPLVLNALVGFSGVNPTLESIKCNKTLALANKESLVVAGFLMGSENLAAIIPVDSEHFGLKELLDSHKSWVDSSLQKSAIVDLRQSTKINRYNSTQCVDSHNDKAIKKLIITASGGAFRDLPLNEIPNKNAKDALKHPTWAMGRKITIDSATMINKLFEILEARWLFNTDRIDAIIERTSKIHALIQRKDNTFMTHFSVNDMRLPIAYALLGQKARQKSFIKALDLLDLSICFEKIDLVRYPLWNLKDLLLKCPKLGIIINAANDILVARFLDNAIPFGKISDGIFKVLDRFGESAVDSIKNIDEIVDLNAKIADFLKDY